MKQFLISTTLSIFYLYSYGQICSKPYDSGDYTKVWSHVLLKDNRELMTLATYNSSQQAFSQNTVSILDENCQEIDTYIPLPEFSSSLSMACTSEDSKNFLISKFYEKYASNHHNGTQISILDDQGHKAKSIIISDTTYNFEFWNTVTFYEGYYYFICTTEAWDNDSDMYLQIIALDSNLNLLKEGERMAIPQSHFYKEVYNLCSNSSGLYFVYTEINSGSVVYKCNFDGKPIRQWRPFFTTDGSIPVSINNLCQIFDNNKKLDCFCYREEYLEGGVFNYLQKFSLDSNLQQLDSVKFTGHDNKLNHFTAFTIHKERPGNYLISYMLRPEMTFDTLVFFNYNQQVVNNINKHPVEREIGAAYFAPLQNKNKISTD